MQLIKQESINNNTNPNNEYLNTSCSKNGMSPEINKILEESINQKGASGTFGSKK